MRGDRPTPLPIMRSTESAAEIADEIADTVTVFKVLPCLAPMPTCQIQPVIQPWV
jgi:hypothetical protein